jgi:predicted transcriptional regulator
MVDTGRAVNIGNDTKYKGVNQLYLKDHQKRNGFPTAEYATRDEINAFAAASNDSSFPIRKGEKGVTITFNVLNADTNKYETVNTRLFNVAQLVNPDKFREYADGQRVERRAAKEQQLKAKYGDKFELQKPGEKIPGPDIACSSTEPDRYLGQYFAAVAMGSNFTVTEQQKGEFQGKMLDRLGQRLETAKITSEGLHATDPFSLNKVCNVASQQCKEIMSAMLRPEKVQKQEPREQKFEQTRSKGRSL